MLVNQMHDDFLDYQADDFISVDKIFGGSKRNKSANIVVGNIDSLVNYDSDFFSQFSAVFFDEAHKLKTTQYKELLSFMNENFFEAIYSVSGTFYGPKEPEEFAAEALSGPILFRVGAKELMDEGSVAKVKIIQLNFTYGVEISEQYYNHEDCQHVGKRMHFENDFIKSIQKRRQIIHALSGSIEFNQLMLFRSKSHCKMYKDLLTELFPDKTVMMIHGDISSQEREHIKQVTEQNLNVIICATYATMSTGVSIKNLSTLHMVDSSKSFIWVRQSIGRTLRLHPAKTHAVVFDYVDKFIKYDESWNGPKVNITSRHGKFRKKLYAQQKFEFTERSHKIE